MANETNTKTAPEAPKTEQPKEKKGPKPVAEVFPTAEAALKEANSRDKGARRAFKTTGPDGKDIFSVTANAERAAWNHFTTLGGKVEELGAKARAPKIAGPEAIMAALAALPEDQRKTIMDQLGKMNTSKK